MFGQQRDIFMPPLSLYQSLCIILRSVLVHILQSAPISPQVAPISPQVAPISPQATQISLQVATISPISAKISPQVAQISPQVAPISPQKFPERQLALFLKRDLLQTFIVLVHYINNIIFH